MLLESLAKAAEMGCQAIEIERKDGREWVFGFVGPVGVGIGSVAGGEYKALFQEIDTLKKAKRATLAGQDYRLVFSEYESFGEWVHRIELKVVKGSAVKKGASGKG